MRFSQLAVLLFACTVCASDTLRSEPTTTDATPKPTTPSKPILKPIGNTIGCVGVTERKEVRQMKADGDLDAFIRAFKMASKEAEGLIALVKMHVDIASGGQFENVHATPRTWPWHRVYLKKFEQILQKYGAKYIPYWDWSVDSQAPWESEVLTEAYFGSPNANTGVVENGPFREGEYVCQDAQNSLTRDYDPNPTGPVDRKKILWHSALIAEIFEHTTFSKFSYSLEEGPHNKVHAFIGGQIGDMMKQTSPEDPLFWLHHAFLDKLWDSWYKRNPTAKFEGKRYAESEEKTEAQRKEFSEMNELELLKPWQIPIKNVLHIKDSCVKYIDPVIDINKKVKIEKIEIPEMDEDAWLRMNKGASLDAAKKVKQEIDQEVDKKGQEVNERLEKGDEIIQVITSETSFKPIVPPKLPPKPEIKEEATNVEADNDGRRGSVFSALFMVFTGALLLL